MWLVVVALALPLIALPWSVGFTTLHILEESKSGDGAPFWRYFHGHFGGPRVPDWLGVLLFAALWGVQVGLAVAGYLLGDSLLLGGLVGARLGDALLSHGLLRWRFGAPNPGLLSSPYYVAEAAIAPLLFTVSLTGAAIGFGVFAGFWALSFAWRALPRRGS